MKQLSPYAEDLTGQKFGKLTVVAHHGYSKDHHVLWECLCDCGNKKITQSNSLKRKKGGTVSCGCATRIAAQAKTKKDGAWNEGKSYAINGGTRCYKTKHGWAKAVLRHYGNRCEICGWNKAKCDTHHRVPKAKYGLHTIENGQVICPNCHREIHQTKKGYDGSVMKGKK